MVIFVRMHSATEADVQQGQALLNTVGYMLKIQVFTVCSYENLSSVGMKP